MGAAVDAGGDPEEVQASTGIDNIYGAMRHHLTKVATPTHLVEVAKTVLTLFDTHIRASSIEASLKHIRHMKARLPDWMRFDLRKSPTEAAAAMSAIEGIYFLNHLGSVALANEVLTLVGDRVPTLQLIVKLTREILPKFTHSQATRGQANVYAAETTEDNVALIAKEGRKVLNGCKCKGIRHEFCLASNPELKKFFYSYVDTIRDREQWKPRNQGTAPKRGMRSTRGRAPRGRGRAFMARENWNEAGEDDEDGTDNEDQEAVFYGEAEDKITSKGDEDILDSLYSVWTRAEGEGKPFSEFVRAISDAPEGKCPAVLLTLQETIDVV